MLVTYKNLGISGILSGMYPLSRIQCLPPITRLCDIRNITILIQQTQTLFHKSRLPCFTDILGMLLF